MDFDKWCYSKQIKGNWKEALYHSLAAKFGGVDKITNDEKVWAEEWREVLNRTMAKAIAVSQQIYTKGADHGKGYKQSKSKDSR